MGAHPFSKFILGSLLIFYAKNVCSPPVDTRLIIPRMSKYLDIVPETPWDRFPWVARTRFSIAKNFFDEKRAHLVFSALFMILGVVKNYLFCR